MRIVTTIILALLLCGVVLVIQLSKDSEIVEESESSLLPGLSPSSVDRIEMSMRLQRTAIVQKMQGGRWDMKTPYKDEVKEYEVRAILECLVSNKRVVIPLEKEKWDLPSKGLDPPEFYIVLSDASGTHKISVGKRTPANNQVYVLIEGQDKLYSTGSNVRNILEKNPEDMRNRKLLRMDPFLVNEISIDTPEGTALHAVKRTSRWEIIAPIRTDSQGIHTLISQLASIEVKTNVYQGEINDEVKTRYGLESDKKTFRINLQGGPSFFSKAVIGVQCLGTNDEQPCYRVGEDAVWTVSAVELSKISLELNDYRTRELIMPMRETLRTMKIRRDGEIVFELTRLGGENDKFFEIVKPFKAMANNISDGNETPVYSYLTQVDGIRITDFVSDGEDDLKKYGLDEPSIQAEFTWREGRSDKSIQILFGDDAGDNKVYAAKRDRFPPSSVFKVTKESLAPLMVKPIILRDPRIFPSDIKAVKSASFESNGMSWKIERNADGFFSDDPNSRFQVFLNDNIREKVVRYIPESPALDDPRFKTMNGIMEITIEKADQNSTKVLVVIGSKCDEGWYGKISTNPDSIFLLEDRFMTDFRKLFKNLPNR